MATRNFSPNGKMHKLNVSVALIINIQSNLPIEIQSRVFTNKSLYLK